MAVLGKGHAHGACSLLHAASTGYGAAMALDFPVTVRLLDVPSKRDVHDIFVASRAFSPQHHRTWLDAQGVSGVDENFSFEHVMVVACPHLAAHTCTFVVGHPNRVALGHHRTPTILAEHLIFAG